MQVRGHPTACTLAAALTASDCKSACVIVLARAAQAYQEVTSAVRPRPGRVVFFTGGVLHSARPPLPSVEESRYSIALKWHLLPEEEQQQERQRQHQHQYQQDQAMEHEQHEGGAARRVEL